jgi:protein-tyrosine phosphatase
LIDLHTHLLPGLDDGPETIDRSLQLASAMAADGVALAACTPHVREDYNTTPELMESTLAQLRAELATAQIPLEIVGGGEIAIDTLLSLDPSTRARFGLGGNASLLLVEFPYFGWPLALPSLIAELVSRGITPVLAHPERNLAVRENPRLLVGAVEAGAYVQLTASSLTGISGASVMRCAQVLLKADLAHVIASDAHGRGVPRSALRAGREAVESDALGAWLTDAVPRALLAGVAPPPRPARERRWWPRH